MPIAPYGTWNSPITADLIVAEAVRLGDLAADAEHVWWVEGRPSEGGRQVLVRQDLGGATLDVTPAPYSVRTRVHEYGGGAFAVHGDTVWFSNDADQRLYTQRLGEEPVALTAPGPWRYADPLVDLERERLVCVRESHEAASEPRNELVAVALADGAVTVLASGHDFYAAPRLHPAGTALAFLTWDHPAMPWDGTTLWLAPLDALGAPGSPVRVAGGEEESVFQPEWTPDGTLLFVSDRSGWWQLYRAGDDGQAEGLLPTSLAHTEFGKPYWQFGQATYGVLDDGRLACAWTEAGSWRLGVLDTASASLEELPLPYTSFDNVRAVRAASGRSRIVCLAGGPDRPGAVVAIEPADGAHRVCRAASALDVDEAVLSRPEAIRFASDGFDVHAFFYPPRNDAFSAPDGERPPLIVIGHGGPTGATSAVLDPRIQYWTSRGFAVVDVNYRGSTGFGRAYRDALKGAWGIADVTDCVNAARHLAAAGRVDAARLVIRGGSAGGFTALAALTFHDVFAAGASYYGVSELEALARDTHKFESRYLDSLVGPYPERRDLYAARSPINHTESLSCPVIFFQGLEDRVVPPNQAQMMVDALRAKGLPVAYLAFEGEQHGFRRAETIKRTLEAELVFYGRVFGFEPAGDLESVAIDNLR